MTAVVNLRFEPYDFYIGRRGRVRPAHPELGWDGCFGNPYTSGQHGTRRIVIVKFRAYFLSRVDDDPEFRRRVLELKGKRLGCFCKPLACHGDVIAAWLDAQPEAA